ncbi:class I SAM-dependent methyltransferase [Clostridium hydrogenum]|uniref:class I SAM-dependent methyltransferase n=1 Tax=Clostridium hydrogenum TaxID=2855764 RepID=UPI001F190509|nr:methyltransferase domain-containing protein [Clostridium hydrogenum]
MNYIGDKQYWDEKFLNRGDKILSPESSLVENIKYLKLGSVLDVACGDGRNSIFLLRNGFFVTGVDFSLKAIERLESFATKENLKVSTKQVDLTLKDALKDLDVFDNIVINHYKLSIENISKLENHLRDDGILFVCGFGHKHKVDSKIKEEDLIKPEDFKVLKKSFELVRYIENEDERGFFVTYIFKKKAVL